MTLFFSVMRSLPDVLQNMFTHCSIVESFTTIYHLTPDTLMSGAFEKGSFCCSAQTTSVAFPVSNEPVLGLYPIPIIVPWCENSFIGSICRMSDASLNEVRYSKSTRYRFFYL